MFNGKPLLIGFGRAATFVTLCESTGENPHDL